MSTVQSSQREDIRGVAIMLYTELLKDESSEIDLVGPTLPALKSLLEFPQQDQALYTRLVHALLSACLLHIDEMRGRQGLISDKKVKNNMLAAVLILTVVPNWVKIGRPVVEHCCFLITQRLLEDEEAIVLTAAHCSKTLIAASSLGSPILIECTKRVLPGLIEFIAKMAPLVNDGNINEACVAAIGEVWKAFSAFFSSIPDNQRTRALCILLPTMSLLLSNQQPFVEAVRSQTATQLLSYATSSPAAFKDAAAKLDQSIRDLLEQSIRRAIGSDATSTSATAKPQISLRSF
ncbi:hypothetical protein APHAL10511_000252 [Amanita phalloides]|nr:hypothetical protein APHAL10511_000252 [Amanita phalloides]